MLTNPLGNGSKVTSVAKPLLLPLLLPCQVPLYCRYHRQLGVLVELIESNDELRRCCGCAHPRGWCKLVSSLDAKLPTVSLESSSCEGQGINYIPASAATSWLASRFLGDWCY